MNSYETLAGTYDALTVDVQYVRRVDFLERLFRKGNRPVRTVLDLACGTGTVACLLAERGYNVIATDGSADMLTVAWQKASEMEHQPFFVHQSMPGLRLAEPVDAAVCTLDAINYLTRPKDVQRTFERVYQVLQPGGQFVFDINSIYKFKRMDGQVYLDETEDAYCVWQTRYSPKTRCTTYGVDLFRLTENGTWERSWEDHRERAYTPEELTNYLCAAGFEKVLISGDLRQTPPKPEEDRIVFRCLKSKTRK